MARLVIPTLLDPIMQLSRLESDCLTYLGVAAGRARSTVEGYRLAYYQFRAFLTSRGLDDDIRHFTSENVIAFVESLKAQGIRPTTILSKLAGLSTLAQYGMRQEGRRGRAVLVANPVKTFRWPKKVKNKTRNLMLLEELQAFMRVPRPLNERIARALAFDTGLRASELCQANVGHLHPADMMIDGAIRRCWFLRVVVKGGSVQDVPLSDDMAKAIQDWLLSRNLPKPTDPLLTNSHGQRYTRTALTELFARIAKVAGLSRVAVRAHTLRHTANYMARLAGVDIHVRSRLLTHMGLRAQIDYEHALPRDLVLAREAQRRAFKELVGEGYDTALCQPPETPPGK